ncbi:MAG: hypothetical protein JW990_03250, partial [Thermoleophilia bacterium]|nr:hypothetical protein [Thermoleophilia bacterium]
MNRSRIALGSMVLSLLVGCCLSLEAAEPIRLLVEAEDFTPVEGDWQAKPWGTNYYAATFANCFLSRMAYLGSPEQGLPSVATAEIDVPVADTYLVLCRYEAAYRFETQFGIRIEQGGRVVFDRAYGARDQIKLWAFRQGLQKEVRWGWGPVENIVWQGLGADGDDYSVALHAGKARLTLYKDKQPEPAARRNVDVVFLTNDMDGIR